MSNRLLWGIALFIGLILAYAGLRLLGTAYTDWLWFEQLGYGSVFVTLALSRLAALFVFWATFAVLAGANVWVARYFGQRTREMPLEVIVGDSLPTVPERFKRQRILWSAIVAGLGLFMGLAASTAWATFLRYVHAVGFGDPDPIFGRDLGFYIFTLPVYNFIYGWFLGLFLIVSLLVAASYYHDRSLRNDKGIWYSTPYVRAHFSVLASGFALLLAWGYYLKEYELLYSFRKPAFFGAGYTDLHAQIYAYRLMLLLLLVLAGLLLYNLKSRNWRTLSYAGLMYGSSVLLLSWLAPILFDQFKVKPDELKLETPYIQHAITHTRRAYNLDKVEEVPFPAESTLTFRDIQRNRTTIHSIPLWDRRPLVDTYSQLQEIRSYYRFGGVDVDRYHLNGEYRQVMLAAREFSREQLSLQGETWLNRHFVYTHGYGICMSPASEVGTEGLPRFYVKNIPPVSSAPELEITRPEIYYGEHMRDYAAVGTRTLEFDYPRGDENVYTTYRGRGGVPINSFFRRLAFALRFADPYLLVTDTLTPESRILFDRHIGRRFGEEAPRRFHKLAPFLTFDRDPYLAVVEGRLVWIQDAYTTSSMYPYSEPYGRPYVREMNYIRNAVKATLDAYDGTVTFYVWDPDDPLIQSYMKIFPDLFRPKEALPEAIRAHLRYPIDLFQIQSAQYNTYHMTSPQVFYNREDVWEPATENYGMSERPHVMSPYYVIAKLPDSVREEFVLLQPATPARKDNMIAWLSARSDGPAYGRLMVYKLPKEKLIYGPMLVERRIDQDTDVSREITLWSQRGSDVIRGNLLVIPIENSFIYVEPLYLRASQSGMPELKRVLVIHGEKLAMAETLDLALQRVFGTRAGLAEAPSSPGEPDDSRAVPATLKQLIQTAQTYFDQAQQRLRDGNFSGYGESIEDLKQALSQLGKQAEINGR